MSELLYQRQQPSGPVVRVRRLTDPGVLPVRAVLELDRRAGRARNSGETGFPPPLITVEGDSETAVVDSLRPFADDDSAIARLSAQHGARVGRSPER